MVDSIMQFLGSGLLGVGWLTIAVYTIISCHITLLAVTLYLHRCECHLAIKLHPVVSHFFRFWLWLTTGMSTRGWVSVHRKHHAKVETDEDPHSPYVYGVNTVLLKGVELYRAEQKLKKTIQDYGHGTPSDWLENHLYEGNGNKYGIRLLLILYILCFGMIGVSFWAIHMISIPFLAAGVINGVGHYYGYRNFSTPDGSTNIVPLGIIIAGEELHNNHHAYPSSAKFSLKPWEFDIGWMYIVILRFFGLAKVNKTIPRVSFDYSKCTLSQETLKAVFKARMHVTASYSEEVMQPSIKKALTTAKGSDKNFLQNLSRYLLMDKNPTSKVSPPSDDSIVERFPIIKKALQYKKNLEKIWDTKFESQERLLAAMREWCLSAEKSDIPELKSFVRLLYAYQVEPTWH